MKKLLLCAGALFLPAASAQAVTITFEGQSNTIYDAPILRSGFNIGNVAGDEQHFHEIDSTQFGLPSNGTGVLLNDRDTRIFVTEASAAIFTLTSVDVASALSNGPAIGLTITGFLGAVQTGQIAIASLGNGYTTVNGGSLGTIDRLVFDGIGGAGGFVFDNLSLNEGGAVPEPATWALMIAGFGMAGAAVRRRTRIAFA